MGQANVATGSFRPGGREVTSRGDGPNDPDNRAGATFLSARPALPVAIGGPRLRKRLGFG